MPQNHIFSFLKLNKNTLLPSLWSLNPNGKILIFVHGFQIFDNSPTIPWHYFLQYLEQDIAFSQYDVLFYGYDCKKQVSVIQQLLSNFVIDLLDNTKKYFKKSLINSLSRKGNLQYEKVFIIAHSLGALVSRCALNSLFDVKPHLAELCKLILFAPAHNGERCTPFIKAILSEMPIPPIPLFIGNIIGYKYCSLDDLKPNSNTIINLKNKINSLIDNGLNSFTIAAKTIWAEDEKVVINEEFCKDIRPPDILSVNHTSINKPNKKFLDPIDLIKKVI